MRAPKGLLAFVVALLAVAGIGGGVVLADHDRKTVTEGEIPLTGDTWGKSEVTWSVSVSGGAPAGTEAAMLDGLADWAHEAASATGGAFTLRVAGASETPDITLNAVGGGGRIAGSAQWSSTNGLLDDCTIRISGKSFGRQNTSGAIEAVTEHEVGHCLGLGHATSSQDLMFGTIQNPPVTELSTCDIDAWLAAMDWLVKDATPHAPTVNTVACGSPSPSPSPAGDPADTVVATDKSVYFDRETVIITVHVEDSSRDDVAGADVTVTLTTPKGRILSGSNQTDANGDAAFTYKVKAGRDGRGPNYNLSANACNSAETACAIGEASFEVQ